MVELSESPPAPATGKSAYPTAVSPRAAASQPAIVQPAPAAPKPSGTLLIETSVRSGQAIVHPEGDVTVIGSVSSGAEIVAGGSIHIYGTLRGRALAGMYGNGRARVFCRRLEAELVAIDGFYKVADELEPYLHKKAVQAWLEGGTVVTSGKGGVGKTTSTAALGAALAQSGKKVVVVDFDVGLRNLDLVMGAERRVVYDLDQRHPGRRQAAQALIRDKRWTRSPAAGLADPRQGRPVAEGVERGHQRAEAQQFDWVICDSPAGIERGATLAMRHADMAVVVTNPEVSSVRDSDRIIGLLDSKTLKRRRASAWRSTCC
jgi:Mrp family chromosome partitioning ATPase